MPIRTSFLSAKKIEKLQKLLKIQNIFTTTEDLPLSPGRIWFRSDINSLRFSIDNERLCELMRVRNYSMPSLTPISYVEGLDYDGVHIVEFTRDGKYLIAVSANSQSLELLTVPELQRVIRLSDAKYSDAFCVAVSPNNDYIAISYPNIGKIELLSLPDLDLVNYFENINATSVGFSQDGKYLACSTPPNGKHLFTVPDLDLVISLPIGNLGGEYAYLSTSRITDFLIAGTSYLDLGYFYIEKVAIPSFNTIIGKQINEPFHCIFKYITTSPYFYYVSYIMNLPPLGTNKLYLLKTSDLDVISVISGLYSYCVFTMDEKYLIAASNSENKLYILSVPDLAIVKEISNENTQGVKCIAVSPDGKYIAVASTSNDRVVLFVWESRM